MEIYAKYENELSLHINTAVTMIHNFETGENSIVSNCEFSEKSIGLNHARVRRVYDDVILTSQDLPKIFTLSIRFIPQKEQFTDNMFREMVRFAHMLPGAQIKSLAPIERTRVDYNRPKAEFLTEFEKINYRNKVNLNRYTALSQELRDMNIKVGEFVEESIPSNFYETCTYYDYGIASIDISCHFKVEAYDILVGLGMVVKSLSPSDIATLKEKKYYQRIADAY